MRSLVTKCLALGIASMCLLGTAHTQQVPPELRGRIQKLQAREHALLDARRVLTDLVSDRANLVLPLQVSDDDDQTRLPVAVPRTAYAADLVLWATDEGNWISSPIARQIAPEGIMKWALQWDRVLRQVIQEHKIPEIDKELAQVRSEFDKLMARTGGRPSTAAATAASGILVVSGRLDQEDVDRRNQHLLRDFSYKASSYDAGSVTLEIFPPAASGRPYTARITGQVDFKRHLLHPTRPGEQFEEWWDVTVTLGPGQGTLDRLEGPASAIVDYRSKAPDRSTRNSYNNERWSAARQPDGSYRLTMPGISDGVPFLLGAR